jgi:hypothetical protein
MPTLLSENNYEKEKAIGFKFHGDYALLNRRNYFILCLAQGVCKMDISLNNIRRTHPLHNTYLATAATIFTLAAIFASTTNFSPVSASTGGNNTTITNTTSVDGEQEAVRSTATTTNNASNALLGRLFSYDEGEDVQSNVNPINETYIIISYSSNRIIMPPNATDIINATETGNVTINIQPNGLSFNQGHAIIRTERGAGAEEGGENATISFVLLTRTNPDGSGSGTSVTYFSTNSTGQLAFLDKMVAIGQVEYSPEEGINRFAEWEWKGGTLPFENLIPQR